MIERALVVGLGSIGRRHARLLRQLLPGARIAAWRRPSSDRVPIEGIDETFTNLDEVLRFAPQGAVIANPASVHMEAALPLARAGVHLLVEKPIAAMPAGVAELLAASTAAGIVLMTGYNMRFSPSLLRFRELLAQRRVGALLSVRAEVGQYLPSWRPGTDYRESVSARAALGGGVLLELSHEIDYLRWLFGEITSVNAVLRRQSRLEIDVEDTAHLVLGFAASAGAQPLVAALNMDFVRQDAVRNCTVLGEEGSLRWNAMAGTCEFFGSGASGRQLLSTDAAERDFTYLAQLRCFLDCIAGKAQPSAGGADGLAVLQVIEAARCASSSGQTVQVTATVEE